MKRLINHDRYRYQHEPWRNIKQSNKHAEISTRDVQGWKQREGKEKRKASKVVGAAKINKNKRKKYWQIIS